MKFQLCFIITILPRQRFLQCQNGVQVWKYCRFRLLVSVMSPTILIANQMVYSWIKTIISLPFCPESNNFPCLKAWEIIWFWPIIMLFHLLPLILITHTYKIFITHPSNVAKTASMKPSPSTSATRIPAALELETVVSQI